MSTLDVTITSSTQAKATWPGSEAPTALTAADRKQLLKKAHALSVDLAVELGGPIEVTITDGDKQSHITVQPDGSAERSAPTSPIPVVPPVEPAPVAEPAPVDEVAEPVVVTAAALEYAAPAPAPASAVSTQPAPAPAPEKEPMPAAAAVSVAKPAAARTVPSLASPVPVAAPPKAKPVPARPMSTLVAPQITPAATSPARQGLRGRLNAALRLGLTPTPGSSEMRIREAAAVLNRPLSDFGRVVVANLKGGVGKTPMAVALSNTLASHRGAGTVVCADLAEVGGSLAHRVAVPPKPGMNVLEMLAAADTIRARPASLSAYLTRQPGGDDVIIGYQGLHGTPLGIEETAQLAGLLAPQREILVADTGNNGLAGCWVWSVSNASVLVVPVPLRRDAAVFAQQMLQDIAAIDPNLLSRTIVVITDGPGDAPMIESEAVEAFLDLNVAKVLRAPFEPLFASGERIIPAALHPNTIVSMTVIAAAVIELMTTGSR